MRFKALGYICLHWVMMPACEMEPVETGPPIEVVLAGDVMTGRGIDQILEYSVDPELHESWVKDARDYVDLAERANGRIPAPVQHDYIWGAAVEAIREHTPDIKIINLETSVTTSMTYSPNKGIHYRMHPKNTQVLKVAGIDACVLANNHLLDWGRDGLLETLENLRETSIKTIGAGRDHDEAWAPAIFTIRGQRVLIWSFGLESAGVPRSWAAGAERSGIAYLPDLSANTLELIRRTIDGERRNGDAVIVSLHWGSNWGYRVPREHRRFAHGLIDNAHVNIVFGHSSHHPRPVELYNRGIILYGCGDFINDYEGISGYEEFRSDLRLLYLVSIGGEGENKLRCRMIPFRAERFSLEPATLGEARWLAKTLHRESLPFDTSVDISDTGILTVSRH